MNVTQGLTAAQWAASESGRHWKARERFTEFDTATFADSAQGRYQAASHAYRRQRWVYRCWQDHHPAVMDRRPKPARSPLRELLGRQRDRRHGILKLLAMSRAEPNASVARNQRRMVAGYLRRIDTGAHEPLRLVNLRIASARQQARPIAAADACAAMTDRLVQTMRGGA